MGGCRKVGVRREGSPQGGEEEGVRGEGLRPLAPVGLSDHCEANSSEVRGWGGGVNKGEA